MKAIFLLCALVVAVHARPEQYTAKYDYVDYKEPVANRRLLVAYIKCILDQGKCTPEGTELKSHISDAMKTNCSKCTPKQREGTRYVIAHLIKHEPEYWKQLCDKYDPEGKYASKYEKELKTDS
uniref:Chemosensory protein n=1 Tax=Heliothis virescens TaxID=7102 RepID=D2SNY4_HELVI